MCDAHYRGDLGRYWATTVVVTHVHLLFYVTKNCIFEYQEILLTRVLLAQFYLYHKCYVIYV
jgi:hypothetical protein